MGRKIPGRKHKGIRDVLKQKAEREEKLKHKINAPPSNPDDQEMPKSMLHLIKMKEAAKNYKFNPIKKKKPKKNLLLDTSIFVPKEVRLPGMTRPDKLMPKLVQWQGESDEKFMERVDDAAQSVIEEIEMEQHFSVHVKRNSKSGAVEYVENAEPDEFEKMYNQKFKDKRLPKKKKTFVDEDGNPILSSKERRKLKTKLKKAEISKDREEKKMERDHVEFGEVVHRPPKITARPRNASLESTYRPGLKTNLLLQGLTASKPGGKSSGGWKNLSMPAKQKMEQQRTNAVAAYRMLKAQRNKARH